MNAKKLRLEGRKFGAWTVLQDSGNRDRHRRVMWRCQCVCGAVREVSGPRLTSGQSRHCGCSPHMDWDRTPIHMRAPRAPTRAQVRKAFAALERIGGYASENLAFKPALRWVEPDPQARARP